MISLGIGIAVFGITLWWWLAFAVHFVIIAFGIGFGFHRTIAHQAVDAFVFPKRLAALIGLFANVGSPLSWARLDGLHHAHADSAFAEPFEVTSDDAFLVFLHDYYYLILLTAAAAAATACLAGWKVFYFALLAPSALSFLSLRLGNHTYHLSWGYRNHETPDASHNLIWTWPLLFGENWHNNHHHDPQSKTTKTRWWEFDPVSVFCFLFDRRTYLKLRYRWNKLKLRFQSKPKDYIYYEAKT